MPTKKLSNAFRAASTALNKAVIKDSEVVASIEFVCRNPQNRAGVRVLLACALAKVKIQNRIRKPYTEKEQRIVILGVLMMKNISLLLLMNMNCLVTLPPLF